MNAKIEILDVKVKVGKNKLILDQLPNDSGHFITIKVNDRVLNNNLARHLSVELFEKEEERKREEKIKVSGINIELFMTNEHYTHSIRFYMHSPHFFLNDGIGRKSLLAPRVIFVRK